MLPTVVEPLRADWANAQAAALLPAAEADGLDGKKREAKLAEARAEIHRFHHPLCTLRVIDPACEQEHLEWCAGCGPSFKTLRDAEPPPVARQPARADARGSRCPAASPAALDQAALAERFSGRGP